ncbi:MAG: hypothetical protein JXA41_07030 [Deltaproteobacteria bacterium]|nr:hypothetical protein [Deltaproteobacteria bacterium]
MMRINITISAMILSMILSTTAVYADNFYKLVGYECDKEANTITLSYTGAHNEDGEKMVANKSSRQWELWSLVATIKDEDHIGSLKTIQHQCELKDGTYTITIGPSPGNFNIQGRCGAFMSAWAEVRRGSNVVLPRHDFEADCHDTETPVTTAIIIKAGSRKPIIKTVPWDDFYK